MQLYDIARVLETTHPNFAVTRFISRRRSFGSHFANRHKQDAMTSRNDYFVARVTLERIGNDPVSRP